MLRYVIKQNGETYDENEGEYISYSLEKVLRNETTKEGTTVELTKCVGDYDTIESAISHATQICRKGDTLEINF